MEKREDFPFFTEDSGHEALSLHESDETRSHFRSVLYRNINDLLRRKKVLVPYFCYKIHNMAGEA